MKVFIVGAGIAGLALAGCLGRAGVEVTVAERAPGPRPQGYMIDFFGPGAEAADALGVLPRIRELGHRFEEAAFVDERGRTRASLGFDSYTAAFGDRLVSILRPDLERALREWLPPQVELRYGTAPVSVADQGDAVRVELSDGSTATADVLVGADGIHSSVRSLVFGPEEDYLHPLGFHTAAYFFRDPELHAQVRERFLLTDTLGAQIGLYGLPDGRIAAFAVHRTADPAVPADPRAALRAAYGHLGWVVPRVLEQCPPAGEVYYDVVAQTAADRWSRGRTVLLGDSGQAVSLLAGQGASLAVGGAFVLAGALVRYPREEAFAHFERVWRPPVEERQRSARRGAEWFLPDSRTRLALRRAALRLSAVPGVDRWIATSLSGKPTRAVAEAAAAAPLLDLER